MTARAGYEAAVGSHGSAVDRRNGKTPSFLAAPLVPAARWKMRAKNSLGTLVTWLASGADPDETGLQYTGGNLPLTGIHVAVRCSV